MTATFEQCTDELILAVEGTLRVPLNSGLSERVHALLLGGKRRILLDLGRLDDIDAGGIGELVRALNATNEEGGVLRIAHANRRVHRLLDVAGVLQFVPYTWCSDGDSNASSACRHSRSRPTVATASSVSFRKNRAAASCASSDPSI
jgi:anti-sigma B factor antagonist